MVLFWACQNKSIEKLARFLLKNCFGSCQNDSRKETCKIHAQYLIWFDAGNFFFNQTGTSKTLFQDLKRILVKNYYTDSLWKFGLDLERILDKNFYTDSLW